jgi:galactonate dehydratase
VKIVSVTARLIPPRWSLVRIETDTGLVGWGEPTLEGHARSAVTCVQENAPLLVGEDPRRVAHLWQALYRGSFYRGGPLLTSALSGIEQALWDIVGKDLGVPVYALLGGACRDRIRMYAHAGGATPEEAAASARRLQAQGFDCLKTGAVNEPTALVDTPRVVDEAVARIAAIRAAVGTDFDIAIDCHGRLSPAMALRFCDAVEPLRPMFVEEPVLPDNVEALARLTRQARVPIATGERLFTKWAFREVLERCTLAVVQPDLSHAGGILECHTIAMLAEAWYAGLAPHCPLGPVALAACLQVDACCPNFLVQEHGAAALGAGYLKQPFVVERGYIALPTGPGLGIEVDEEAIAAMPEHDWLTPQWRHKDGSVADW